MGGGSVIRAPVSDDGIENTAHPGPAKIRAFQITSFNIRILLQYYQTKIIVLDIKTIDLF